LVDEGLGFRAEGEVGEEDGAVLREEEGGEGKVYAFVFLVSLRALGWDWFGVSLYIPEPAPVTIAVFPFTENGVVVLLVLLRLGSRAAMLGVG
jgi:hypothetical protein